MPRINALNILLESDGKEYLAELYGKTIEGVQKALISGSMKNMDLSGDPVSGTVEAKRFVNATPKNYGTARTAGKGDAVKAKPSLSPSTLTARSSRSWKRRTFACTALTAFWTVVPQTTSCVWLPSWTMCSSPLLLVRPLC